MALRRNKTTEHPSWRPDFRDAENLPDIKAIRTDFLLNLVAVSIAIGLFGLFAYREYRSIGLRDGIEGLKENIETNRALDRENVRMSNEFKTLQESMDEVIRFHNVPVLPHTLLVDLAAIQPDAVILRSVNCNGTVERQGKKAIVRYQLILTGTVEDRENLPASQVITDYRAALAQLPALAPYFLESEQPGFDRDPSLGLFNFTIRVTLSDELVKTAS